MDEHYKVIKKLLRTEKGMGLSESINKYCFEVNIRSNKIQIKNAVEKIYGVKVTQVNTIIVPRKPKLVRRNPGTTSERKKAMVQLAKDSKIDLTV